MNHPVEVDKDTSRLDGWQAKAGGSARGALGLANKHSMIPGVVCFGMKQIKDSASKSQSMTTKGCKANPGLVETKKPIAA